MNVKDRHSVEPDQATVSIIYWGPEGAGKSTSLGSLHDRTPLALRGRFLSLSTKESDALFFERRLEGSGTGGTDRRILLTALSDERVAQSILRRSLEDADAVVFVAGSRRRDLERVARSLACLESALGCVGREGQVVPLVFQYNQRDLRDAVPVEELNRLLNHGDHPWKETVATLGDGVLDTLEIALELACRRAPAGREADPMMPSQDDISDGAVDPLAAPATSHPASAPPSSAAAASSAVPDGVEFYRPAKGTGETRLLEIVKP